MALRLESLSGSHHFSRVTPFSQKKATPPYTAWDVLVLPPPLPSLQANVLTAALDLDGSLSRQLPDLNGPNWIVQFKAWCRTTEIKFLSYPLYYTYRKSWVMDESKQNINPYKFHRVSLEKAQRERKAADWLRTKLSDPSIPHTNEHSLFLSFPHPSLVYSHHSLAQWPLGIFLKATHLPFVKTLVSPLSKTYVVRKFAKFSCLFQL